MNKPIRIVAVLSAAAMLAACGSKPLPQPAAVTHSRDAMSLGMQAYNDNRYLEARGYFERALVQYRSVDDRTGQLDTLVDLADSALGQGDYAAANSYLADADTILANGASGTIAAHVALLHAYADMQAGDKQQAVIRLDKLLDDAATAPDIHQAALFARSQCAFDLGAADAAQWLDKLAAALGKQSNTLANARYQRLQALDARKHGDSQKAAALYQSALDSYRSSYYRPGIAATLEEWADLLITRNDWAGAHDRLHRALNIRLWLYDRRHSVRDLENLSQVDTHLGDAAAAKQDMELADYLKNGGNPEQLPAQTRQ
ncbi:MAG TPA: tetratricopeptide repeat protein [Gammaproteobacteria bacterium]|nr:tetratricopeptide repeat protein [Gammaproteobacteria bacterium]